MRRIDQSGFSSLQSVTLEISRRSHPPTHLCDQGCGQISAPAGLAQTRMCVTAVAAALSTGDPGLHGALVNGWKLEKVRAL
jgi:hypothetical protein